MQNTTQMKDTFPIQRLWRRTLPAVPRLNYSIKDLGALPQHPDQLLKKLDQNFYQNAISLHFSEENYKLYITIWLFQILPNKINFALILNRKSCICYRKHCRAYFRRHMECAVLKRFLKVQGTFAIKKFLANPTFPFGKN